MSKESFTTGKLTFDGTQYGVISFSYSERHDEVEVTDTNTSGDGKEFVGGRSERTCTVQIVKDPTVADLAMNSEKSATLDYEGFTYAGTLILLEKTADANIDDKMVMTYTGRFNGTVTETVET